MNELASQLQALGLRATADTLDDLLARATQHRLGPRALLEDIVRSELAERAQRSLERRRLRSRLGAFKPIADFDWNWPKKIDRPLHRTGPDPGIPPRGTQPRPARTQRRRQDHAL